MSQEVLFKRIKAVAGQREIERIQSISDDQAREDACLNMIYGSGEQPQSLMYRSKSMLAIFALHEIRDSIDTEMQSHFDVFFGSLPERYAKKATPLPIGKSYPVIEEHFDGWLLTVHDIEQLIQLGRAIVAYCNAEIDKIPVEANRSWVQRVFAKGQQKALEKKEQCLREISGYVSRWLEVLEDANKSGVELLVSLL